MRRIRWTTIVPSSLWRRRESHRAAVGQPIVRVVVARGGGGRPGSVSLPYRMMQADAAGNG